MLKLKESGEAEAPRATSSHKVFNTPDIYGGYNLWDRDIALRDGVTREGAGWAAPELQDFGAALGA